MSRDLVENADYFVRYLRFPNRANPSMVFVNDDGTFDIYLNTRFDKEFLREKLEHELRHLRDEHFFVDLPIQTIERQADGESVLAPVLNPPPGMIAQFRSQAALAHWLKTVAAQLGFDLSRADIRKDLFD